MEGQQITNHIQEALIQYGATNKEWKGVQVEPIKDIHQLEGRLPANFIQQFTQPPAGGTTETAPQVLYLTGFKDNQNYCVLLVPAQGEFASQTEKGRTMADTQSGRSNR